MPSVCCTYIFMILVLYFSFFFSSRRRHTRCALVTGVQTCALPISTGPRGVDWRAQRETFVAETDRFLALLEGVLPEVSWLDDAATLTYLHGTVSGVRHPVTVPSVPMHLDAWLADTPLAGGVAPKLGDAHLRAITVRGFPDATWPGLLAELNRLGFGYRWVTRVLGLSKAGAAELH